MSDAMALEATLDAITAYWARVTPPETLECKRLTCLVSQQASDEYVGAGIDYAAIADEAARRHGFDGVDVVIDRP